MDSNNLLTCRVTNGLYVSTCSLIRTSSIKYFIDVTLDPLAIFEGFESLSSQFDKMKPKNALEVFQELCLDAFTCHGEFTIEEVRQNGEKIEFSTE